MYELNLGFDNQNLYRNCKVTPIGDGRYRLDTSLDSAVIILAADLLELLKTIPKRDRDCLVLTGAVPAAIYITAQAMLGPFFKKIEHFDGKKRITIPQLPTPPQDFKHQQQEQ